MVARAETVTILFTDLVGSTELLQRAGDDRAQRIFKAHHRLLLEAVRAHGGHEVKWLGDGLMVAFDSAVEATRCAIAMQQSSRRPTAGERLQIRAGLNIGEALLDESDYFGSAVVIARRLCDRAAADQIFASELVGRLLESRGSDIRTKDLGALELKGITKPVPSVEILYEHDPLALLRRMPFVGRNAQYEKMVARLDRAISGKGSVVLLSGEPGIGKTRLAEEFCEYAGTQATVIRGNSYEGDVSAPFGPWLEAMHSLIDKVPDAALNEVVGDGAPEIAAMMPDIRKRLPDIPEAHKLDAGSERARLFEAVVRLLERAASKRPLVVFFDDLQWSDKPALALIEHAARKIAEMPIVLVGTYRDVEVDRVHPLAQTLATLRRMEHYERIALHGLGEDTVLALLAAIEPSERSEPARRALAAALSAEAGGNPFFIGEVLNNLVESGRLVQKEGTWLAAFTSIGDLGMPEGIKEVVGRRLSRLSEGANRMLQRASAMTSGFTWEELRAICDEPEDALLDYLDEALGAQLLIAQGKLAYAFMHALIRATLYEELSAPRRVSVHRRIAQSLEKLYEDGVDQHLAELAHHFTIAAQAGDADSSLKYNRLAGDHAMKQLAYEDAIMHYAQALEVLELKPVTTPHDRYDLLLTLADAMMKGGEVERSRDVLEQAVGIARELGDGERMARAMLLFSDPLLEAFDTNTRHVELLEEAISGLGESYPLLRIRLVSRLANTLRLSEIMEAKPRSRPLAAQALEEARQMGDKDTLLEALDAAFNNRPAFDIDEGMAISSEIIRLAEEDDNKLMSYVGRTYRSMVLLELGDIAGFDEELAMMEWLAGELRLSRLKLDLAVVGAARAFLGGRREEGWALVRRYLHDGEGLLSRHMLLVEAANAPCEFGETPPDIMNVEAAINELTKEAEVPVRHWNARLAYLYALTGRVSEARDEFEVLAANNFVEASDTNTLLTLIWLAYACWRLGDTNRAGELYDLLEPFAAHNSRAGNEWSMGSVSRYLGLLAVTMGKLDDATRHYNDAIEMNERMGARPWLAFVQRDYAELLQARDNTGDREKAAVLLRAALTAADEMAMGKLLDECGRMLAAL